MQKKLTKSELGNGATEDVLAPASPKITKAQAGDGQVALNRTSVSGASQYAVYYYLNGKWTSAGTTTPSANT